MQAFALDMLFHRFRPPVWTSVADRGYLLQKKVPQDLTFKAARVELDKECGWAKPFIYNVNSYIYIITA